MNQQRTGPGWGNRERRQTNTVGDRGRENVPPRRSAPQNQPRSRSGEGGGRGNGEGQGEPSRGFKDLIVWQRATELAVAVYGLAKQLPVEEDAALGGPLRCTAVSVATSIAAGHARHDATAFALRLQEARDHLSGLETLMEIAVQLGCLRETAVGDVTPTMVSVRQLLQRLIQRVETQEQA